MIALALATIGIVALILGAYRLGSSLCEPDLMTRDAERNTALTVVALAIMFIMCAMLSAMAPGRLNPFDAVTNPTS